MLSMIRHGANYVFSSKDSDITDKEIDDILAEGQKRTEEMKKKLEQLGESQLKKFTFDNEEEALTKEQFLIEIYDLSNLIRLDSQKILKF
ncbi:Chromatin-remodeling complex ATPase chain Iswi [Brachionus plicatilis]|uniref:Chromatin-remodeling complex ATPase chain Iswi n=1 Tax=Brachionus plicatilis TaxID=10195 RepID=A0A3M7PGB6_BRAPC|nr:Chromatin-remodeling complex ATPase chain Iswi [Brachionus plicatilis]